MPRPRLDPYTTEPRQPIELLARLAGRTNYLTPGRGAGASITALDVAHAIAQSKNRIGAAVAVAVACKRGTDCRAIEAMAYRPMLSELRRDEDLRRYVASPLVYRARLCLSDAMTDLVFGRQRSYRAQSEELGMPGRPYRLLHRAITAWLEDRANAASRDACIYLFASPCEQALKRTGANHAISLQSDTGDIRVWHAADAAALQASIRSAGTGLDALRYLVDLIGEAEERHLKRLSGVLSMRGALHAATYCCK